MWWDTSKESFAAVTVAPLSAQVLTLTVFILDTERILPLWLMHCHAAMVEDVSRRSPSPFPVLISDISLMWLDKEEIDSDHYAALKE